MATSKQVLPSGQFDTEIIPADIKDALKAANAEAVDGQIYVPYEQLYVMPDYNMRIKGPRYKNRVAYLRDNMAVNDYDVTEPITVFAAEIDGKPRIVVQDGHHRHDAIPPANVLRKKAKKPPITMVPIIFKPSTTDSADLQYALILKNSGEPPAPYEAAIVIKRLVNMGIDKKTIAKKLTITPRYVDDLLLLADAPKEIRDAVIAEEVSPTLAIEELRTYSPEDVVARHKKAKEAEAARGAKKIKITKKKLEGVGGEPREKRSRTPSTEEPAIDHAGNLADIGEFIRLHDTVRETYDAAYMELSFEATVGYAATITDRPREGRKAAPTILAQGVGATAALAARAAVEDYKARALEDAAADL